MSFVRAYYHLVINTKHRAANLNLSIQEELYRYLAGLSKGTGSQVIAINGTSNHIHLLVNLSPTIALSEFMKKLKQGSSSWMHANEKFAKFDSWGKEYFATTIAERDIPGVKKYIMNQREHHQAFDFQAELQRIVAAYGGTWMKWMEET